METIDQLLDAVKEKHGIKSDYKLAAFTGKTTHTIANYRHGRSRPDDATLSELAALADIPAKEIHLMAVRFQVARAANDESRKLWESLASRLQMGFARVNILILIAIFSIAACALPYWFSLYSVAASANGLYIMLSRTLKRWTARIVGSVKKCKAVSNVPRNAHSTAFRAP